MSFLKGLTTGMVLGAAVGMMLAPEKKSCRRRLSKVLRTAGDLIEDVTGAIGL